jgi:hypothetical protein
VSRAADCQGAAKVYRKCPNSAVRGWTSVLRPPRG